MITGFSFDPRFLDHDTGPGHPESPQRLLAVMHHLGRQAWYPQLAAVAARAADLEQIERIHKREYVERARATCAAGAPMLDSMDVSVSRETFDVALLAAGTPLALADEIVAGKLNNGFALLRPPGHHAESDMALGFCLFNNVAVLTRHLQDRHSVEKILILDWDVHHGNGTQHTFEADPSVLYISTHQYPFYPGTGAWYEDGIGRGKGATLNCPMPAGSGNHDYEQAFIEKILPKIGAFRPEFVILSAGFDAHRDDPLAQIELSTAFYGWMTDRVLEMADTHAHGRIVSVLEGGYNLQRLPECVALHIRGLGGLGGASA
ncbi:MAG: histone deacetylase [Gammaproteobacteria bacterium]|nr:histone deacetylase [Gammaproteobacteria bacterium]